MKLAFAILSLSVLSLNASANIKHENCNLAIDFEKANLSKEERYELKKALTDAGFRIFTSDSSYTEKFITLKLKQVASPVSEKPSEIYAKWIWKEAIKNSRGEPAYSEVIFKMDQHSSIKDFMTSGQFEDCDVIEKNFSQF